MRKEKDDLWKIWKDIILADLAKPIPSIRYEQFCSKKEENVATHNVIVSADGLAAFIQDLQEMAPATKTKYDENGNTVYNPETGDYVKIDIDLADRWVSLGEIRLNKEGKFVVKISDTTLNSMETLNARRARVAAYEAK